MMSRVSSSSCPSRTPIQSSKGAMQIGRASCRERPTWHPWCHKFVGMAPLELRMEVLEGHDQLDTLEIIKEIKNHYVRTWVGE